MDGITELGDNVYRQKVSVSTDWYYVGMKSCECLVLGMRRSIEFYRLVDYYTEAIFIIVFEDILYRRSLG